jgi:hypothetical protein
MVRLFFIVPYLYSDAPINQPLIGLGIVIRVA